MFTEDGTRSQGAATPVHLSLNPTALQNRTPSEYEGSFIATSDEDNQEELPLKMSKRQTFEEHIGDSKRAKKIVDHESQLVINNAWVGVRLPRFSDAGWNLLNRWLEKGKPNNSMLSYDRQRKIIFWSSRTSYAIDRGFVHRLVLQTSAKA